MLDSLAHEVELEGYTGSSHVIPGTDATGCQQEALGLLREVAELSDKLSVTETPVAGDDDAKTAGITRAPTIAFRRKGEARTNIRYLGLPSGSEFTTLLGAIRIVGSDRELTDQESARYVTAAWRRALAPLTASMAHALDERFGQSREHLVAGQADDVLESLPLEVLAHRGGSEASVGAHARSSRARLRSRGAAAAAAGSRSPATAPRSRAATGRRSRRVRCEAMMPSAIASEPAIRLRHNACRLSNGESVVGWSPSSCPAC